MRKLTLFLCAVFLTMIGYSQGSETFQNIIEDEGNSSSYLDRTWTGDNGEEWSATDARIDQTLNDEAITVRNGELSTTIPDGIGDLTLTTIRAFSGGEGDITVSVNGDVVGTIPYGDTEQTNTVSGIDVAGEITLLLETPGDGDRVVMDDLTWTAAPDNGGDQDGGESCDDPITVSSLPFNDAGNTADYGNNYVGDDVPEEAPNGVFDGTGSTSYLNGNDAVYAYTPDSDMSITISTTNDDEWIGLWAFTGCPFDSTVGYHTGIGGDTREIPELPVTSGETYYFVISNWPSPESTDYTIQITEVTCSMPMNVEVDNITAESADLTWIAGGDQDEWEVLYGESGFDMEEGEGESQIVNSDPETTLENLENDTSYEVYIKALCATDEESDWAGPISFTTEESCAVPSNITADNITANSVDLSWDIVGDQDEWEIFYGAAGFDIDEGEGESETVNNDPETTLEGLDEATAYDVYIKAICEDDDESSLSAVFSFTTTIEGGYCLPTSGENGDEIVNFTLGDFSNDSEPSSSENGFSDFTDLGPIELSTGLNYDASITAGSGSGSHGAAIWIDFNDDGVFSDDERVAALPSESSAGQTLQFPEFSVEETGNFRLRVMYVYLKDGEDIDPCDPGTIYAETEDYRVDISEGVVCADADAGTPVETEIEVCLDTTFTIAVEGASSEESGLNSFWEYNEGDGWENLEDEDGELITNSSVVLNVEIDTDYRYVMECDADGSSDTSEIIEVTINQNPAECYCEPEGTNSSRYIDNFSANGGDEDQEIDNQDSGFSDGGYGDFTDMIVSAEADGEINFEVDIVGGSAGFRIWVDWNNDGSFDTEEEVAYQSSGYSANHDGSLEVPADADGTYRMRIVSHWLSTSGNIDPCETGFTYGEFEDYIIEIGDENGDDFPSPYCDIDPDGVTVEKITAVGFEDTNIVNDNTDDVLIDKTDTVVDVMTGGTYTLEVDGNTGGDFENDIVAFIDWNQNEVLDDEGEVYEVGTLVNSTGENGNSVSLEITIPDDAVLGTTRIRITKTYTDEEGEDPMPPSPAIINPCAIEMDAFEMGAQPGFGQALDFTLNIEEGDNGGDDIDCDQGDISNNFENALQIGTGTDFENADDFIVSPGNTLNIQTIKLNILATEPIESLDLMFYDDDNGPGDIIITEAGLTPSEEDQVLIGEAFDFNVYEVYVNVDLEFEGGDDGASYWMQPQGLAAGGEIGGVFWEVTSEGELGEPIHSREAGGAWLPDEDGLQAVFTLYCDEVEAPEPPVLPCGIDFTASVEPITRVVFAEQIDNSSDTTVDGSNPLEDFTDIEAIVGQGMTYDIALEGNTGGTWENFFTVFIDLTDPEAEGEWQVYEMYEIGSITDSNGEDGQQATGQITLPEDIDDGTYTMRIVKNFNESPMDPCQAYSFGQAEDYTLIVDYELSVDDYQFENFTFYPNPVQNQLNLKAGEQIESVTVHNLLGQKVIDVNPNTVQTQVDVNHLQAGVYLMNVTVNGTQKSFRIVKK